MPENETDAHTRASRTPFRAALEGLSPGYFALVMATGIVSVGLHEVGFEVLSLIMLAIAAISYVVLWVLFVWRGIAYRDAMLHDLRDPTKAFSFFTIVAGTGVLAVRCLQSDVVGVAFVLVALAAVLWFVFGYLLPWQVFMTRDGEPILSRTNGTWFVWAVASQSLAIGTSQIEPYTAAASPWVGMLAVLSWSVGIALYAGIALLVLLRIIHFGITAQEFEPSFWVSMGALAIAVVAGSSIVGMDSTPMVDATRSLIAGTVAIFWTFCIWLIPLLVGAGVWRHLRRRVPLGYSPGLWSMVFPLGMFATASLSVSRIDSLPSVAVIGHLALVVALVVWLIVFASMLVSVVRMLAGRARSAATVDDRID